MVDKEKITLKDCCKKLKTSVRNDRKSIKGCLRYVRGVLKSFYRSKADSKSNGSVSSSSKAAHLTPYPRRDFSTIRDSFSN